jgi:hypothetical protein
MRVDKRDYGWNWKEKQHKVLSERGRRSAAHFRLTGEVSSPVSEIIDTMVSDCDRFGIKTEIHGRREEYFVLDTLSKFEFHVGVQYETYLAPEDFREEFADRAFGGESLLWATEVELYELFCSVREVRSMQRRKAMELNRKRREKIMAEGRSEVSKIYSVGE